jgi:hypothetical protein
MTASELTNLSKPQLIAIILRFERRLNELEAEVATLRKRNAKLEAEVARLRKNSSNSSKPPAPPGQGKRRIGGQPGHQDWLNADDPGHKDNGKAPNSSRCSRLIPREARMCCWKYWARNSIACWVATTSRRTAST